MRPVQTVIWNKFQRGDKLNLAELKMLSKYLWGRWKANNNEAQKALWKAKIDEVSEEIDYWTEVEKTFPFASFEKYTR